MKISSLLTAAACFSVCLPLVPAAVEFAPEEILFRNNPPEYASTGDLNGDGRPDILIGGEAGLRVVLSGDPPGTFGAPATLGTLKTDIEFVVDFDGDGRPDILSVEVPGPSRPIVWYRNLGGGLFGPAIAIRTENSRLTMLPPRDVDGDGDIDLIWHDGQSDLIEWMNNSDGAGTFTGPATLATLPDWFAPQLLDLNGDQLPDFIAIDGNGTGNSDDDVTVWKPALNTLPLSFGPAQTLSLAGVSARAFGDMDGDGDPDMIVSDGDTSSLLWLPNDGTGVFGLPQPLAVPDNGLPDSVRVGDPDGDGHQDVLFQSRVDRAWWCRNVDGAGTFAAPAVLPEPDFLFLEAVMVDLNGDNRQDLLVTDEYHVTWRPGIAAPGLQFGDARVVASSVGDLMDSTTADLDGDGRPEILFAADDGSLMSLSRSPEGNFNPAIPLLGGETGLSKILAVDLDGQQGPDIISLRNTANLVQWHRNTGTGGLLPALAVDDFGYGPSAVAAADFNGDGQTDLAVAFTQDELCGWYSRDPVTHAFTFHLLPGSIAFVRCLAAGDMDGDGDTDLVTADSTGGKIYVYRNNGAGNFTRHLVATLPQGTDFLVLADVDKDGDSDILAGENDGTAATITVLRNDGSGNFPATTIAWSGSAGLSSMAVADFDKDGDPDLVTANFNSDAVSFLENDGTGTFLSTALALDPGTSPYHVFPRDVDGDGNVDIIVASRFDGTVGWLRNRYRPPPPDNSPLTVWAWGRDVSESHLAPQSDSDGDGITLLQEFAFNMDPLQPSSDPVPSNGSSGMPDFWFTQGAAYRARGTFIRRRDWETIGLTYIVESSPDCLTWTPLEPVTVAANFGDYQRVTFNRPLTGNPGKSFVRMRLVYTPPSP